MSAFGLYFPRPRSTTTTKTTVINSLQECATMLKILPYRPPALRVKNLAHRLGKRKSTIKKKTKHGHSQTYSNLLCLFSLGFSRCSLGRDFLKIRLPCLELRQMFFHLVKVLLMSKIKRFKKQYQWVQCCKRFEKTDDFNTH